MIWEQVNITTFTTCQYIIEYKGMDNVKMDVIK